MSLAVLDWRRQVAEIYRTVRSMDRPDEAHEYWRVSRNNLLRYHSASPVPAVERDQFTPPVYAPYDPALRFDAPVEHDVEAVSLEVATGTDGVVPFTRIGRVRLGELGSLDVWWLASYGGGVFVPMRDRNPLTYGGGRYVIDTVKGADLGGDFDPAGDAGGLIVDLNFAYNPSCAYDAAWACPLPPEGNRLDMDVVGGELLTDS